MLLVATLAVLLIAPVTPPASSKSSLSLLRVASLLLLKRDADKAKDFLLSLLLSNNDFVIVALEVCACLTLLPREDTDLLILFRFKDYPIANAEFAMLSYHIVLYL